MSQAVDPTSPPQTPVTASPFGNRKPAQAPSPHHHHHHRNHHHYTHNNAAAQPFKLPVHRHSHSFVPGAQLNGYPLRAKLVHPDTLSPRSSTSSSGMNDDEDDDDEDNAGHTDVHRRLDDDYADDADDDDDGDESDGESMSASPPRSPVSQDFAENLPASRRPMPPHTPPSGSDERQPASSRPAASPAASPVASAGASADPRAGGGTGATAFYRNEADFSCSEEEFHFTIEEIIGLDIHTGPVEIIHPYEIEEPSSSDDSRPGSPGLPDVDRSVLSGLQGLSCGQGERGRRDYHDDDDEESEESDIDEAEHKLLLQKRREDRRRRRMTSGSIGKRTISASIGSDTDTEDLLQHFLEATDVGSSARRLRRRLGDARHSLQCSDPLLPLIEEFVPPEPSQDGESLARELPYYTLEYISMEVDSP